MARVTDAAETPEHRALNVDMARAAIDDARAGLVEAMSHAHSQEVGFDVGPLDWGYALGKIAHAVELLSIEVDAVADAREIESTRTERPIARLADRIDRTGGRKARNGGAR